MQLYMKKYIYFPENRHVLQLESIMNYSIKPPSATFSHHGRYDAALEAPLCSVKVDLVNVSHHFHDGSLQNQILGRNKYLRDLMILLRKILDMTWPSIDVEELTLTNV